MASGAIKRAEIVTAFSSEAVDAVQFQKKVYDVLDLLGEGMLTDDGGTSALKILYPANKAAVQVVCWDAVLMTAYTTYNTHKDSEGSKYARSLTYTPKLMTMNLRDLMSKIDEYHGLTEGNSWGFKEALDTLSGFDSTAQARQPEEESNTDNIVFEPFEASSNNGQELEFEDEQDDSDTEDGGGEDIESFLANDENPQETVHETGSLDDPAVLQARIQKAIENYALLEQDPTAEQSELNAAKHEINTLKALLEEATVKSAKNTMVVDETLDYRRKVGAQVLTDIGASFELTQLEVESLNIAFKDAAYDITKFHPEQNFVAVVRSDFSARFIFSTLGLKAGKRNIIAESFIAYTGYSQYGAVENNAEQTNGWWAITCITDNRKFTVSSWPGTELSSYPDLGNLKKIWLGISLRNKYLSIDWKDAQNSFVLVGGKSRSGKTCLSHSLLIQAICGGMLPTFMDWKPEGSVLYAEQLGYYAVQRDATAWSASGQKEGRHLLNALDALAWFRLIQEIANVREEAGQRDFVKQFATPDDPVCLFVFDEMAAFFGEMDNLRASTKSVDKQTPTENASNTVFELAKTTMKDLQSAMARVSTYGIYVMGITQDIRASDSVWQSKVLGGKDGGGFRLKFQLTAWGRGTTSGQDCPVQVASEKEYVNMGQGRFGIMADGKATTFRALRIDNSPLDDAPGMDAASVLSACLQNPKSKAIGPKKEYFESRVAAIKSLPEFQTAYQAIARAYNPEGAEAEGDEGSAFGGSMEGLVNEMQGGAQPTTGGQQAPGTVQQTGAPQTGAQQIGAQQSAQQSAPAQAIDNSFLGGILKQGQEVQDEKKTELISAEEIIDGWDVPEDGGEQDRQAEQQENSKFSSWEDVPDEAVQDYEQNVTGDPNFDNIDDIPGFIGATLVQDIREGYVDPYVAEAIARKYNLLQGGYIDTYDFTGPVKYLKTSDQQEIPPIRVGVSDRRACEYGGKNKDTVIVNSENTRNVSPLTKDNSIDCRTAGRGPLSPVQKIFMNTPKGAQRYIKSLWKSVLDSVVDTGVQKPHITRVSLIDDQMYVNGKLLILNGVLGGPNSVRLRDIIEYKILFKKYFMMKELRLDIDTLRVACMEFGKDPIPVMFNLAKNLETIYIKTAEKKGTRFNRLDMQNQTVMEQVNKIQQNADMRNKVEGFCKTRQPQAWKDCAISENVWGWKLAKDSMGNARDAFLDKKRPRIGTTLLYLTVGTAGGLLGGAAWAAASTVKGVGNIFKMFGRRG